MSLNYAFSIPRDGILTSLEVFFSVTLATGVSLGNYEVHAQLFRSQNSTSNLFDAISITDITLAPSFSGISIPLGDTARGNATFNVPVCAGDRLLLAFYVVPPTLSAAAVISGYASAGLSIN